MSDPHAKHWLADDANFMATVGDLDRDLGESPDPPAPSFDLIEAPDSQTAATTHSRFPAAGESEPPEMMTYARRAEAEPHGPRRLLNLFPESALEPAEPTDSAPEAAGVTPPPSSTPPPQHPQPRLAEPVYRSASYDEAKEELLAAIREHSGYVLLTAPAGAGKTTLCRAIVDTLDHRTMASLIPEASPSLEDLLTTLLVAFGVMAPEGPAASTHLDRPELIRALNTFLDSLAPLHATAVVFLDQADAIPDEVLAGLDVALASGTGSARVLQLVLVGRPTLITQLQRPDLQGLSEKITRRIALVHRGADGAPVHAPRQPIVERIEETWPIGGEVIDREQSALPGDARAPSTLTIVAVFALLVLAGAGGAAWWWGDAVKRAILEWENVPVPPAGPIRDFPPPIAPVPPPPEPAANLPGRSTI